MKRTPLKTLSAVSVALLCILAMGLTIVAACFKDDLPVLTTMPSGTEATTQDTSLDAPAEEEDEAVQAETPKVEETPADLPLEDNAASEPENKPAVQEEVAETPAKETACEKEDASREKKDSDCAVALPECLTGGKIAIEDLEKLLPDCVNGGDFSTEELEKLLSQCFPNDEITVEDVETLFPDLQVPTEQDENETTVPPTSETNPKAEAKPAPSIPETTKPEAQPETSAPETSKPDPSAPETSKPEPSAPETSKPSAPEAPASSLSAYEKRVAELVNEIRRENGLNELTLSEKLSDGAREKSRNMLEKGYFAHESPTYGSPFDMMKAFGIFYRTAGENIAMGYATPEEVVDAWMNSEGHRANILNPSFTEIGIGYLSNGSYWTQWFIG